MPEAKFKVTARPTVKEVVQFKNQIDLDRITLRHRLTLLWKEGCAKLIYWNDMDGAHRTWLVSENKELLAKIDGIDGFSKNKDYYCKIDDGNDYELIPKTPEILRWTER
jgi:hypothetical protein